MNVDERARSAARQVDEAVDTLGASAPERMSDRFDRFRARKERNQRVGAIGFVVAVLIVLASAAMAIWSQTAGETPANTGIVTAPVPAATLTITKTGCALDTAIQPGVGPLTLHVINATDGPQTIVVFKIASDARFERMLARVDEVRPRFGNPAHGPGHAPEDSQFVTGFFEYAGTSETTVDPHDPLMVPASFDAGTYGIQCAGRAPQHDSSSHFIGPIDVPSGAGTSP